MAISRRSDRPPTPQRALRAAAHCWSRHLGEVLRAERLSPDHWSILSNLSDKVGIPMSELAARSQLPASTTTKYVNYLAERGLIFRYRSQDDRRRILIGLTPPAANLVDSIRAQERRAENRLRRRIGGRGYAELMRLLEAVAVVEPPG